MGVCRPSSTEGTALSTAVMRALAISDTWSFRINLFSGEKFEERRSFGQGIGLHRRAQRRVLGIEVGDRLGVIQALQGGDGLLQLGLLRGRGRLLSGDGIQACAYARLDRLGLIERLIDIVDG